MKLGEPIKIGRLIFESLHADSDGQCIVKLILPPVELVNAARFAVLRDIAFSAVFTPEESKIDEPTL